MSSSTNARAAQPRSPSSNPVRVEGDAREIVSDPAVCAIVGGAEEEQDVSGMVDESATAREQVIAAGTSEDSDPLLELAPEVFRWAATASGVTTVVAGEIERKKLYRAVGFTSFREYADQGLGISSNSAFKKLRQAGRAVWEFYPDLAAAVVKVLQVDGHARVHDLEVPDQTALYLLKRAHENTPENERANLLDKVRGRNCTTRQLEEMTRRSRSVKPPETAAQRRDRDGAKTAGIEQPQPPSTSAPALPTQGKESDARNEVAPGPTTSSASGSARHASAPRTDDQSGADGAGVNRQDLVSQAIWGLDAAGDALRRLTPGEIKADHLSSLRELLLKVERALADHEEIGNG